MPQKPSRREARNLIRTRGLFISACFVFISLGVVAAWFISADSSSSIAGVEPYFRFMLSPWMLVTHALALSFIAFGLWFLESASLRPTAVSNFDATLRQCGRLLILVLALFSSALLVVGYLFVDDLRATFRNQRLAEEEGIARLKAQQIDKWILDRALDTQTLARALRSLPLERLVDDRESRQIVRVIFAEFLANNADRIGISLLSVNGTTLSAVGEPIAAEAQRDAYLTAMPNGDRGLKIVDVHLRDGSQSTLAMDFILPIFPTDNGRTPTAILALSADPGRDLFKQIVRWPVASPGSEVVVLRREGDNLQLLSEAPLLDSVPPPLSFRLPLTQDQLPGVQALQKGDGSREGIDYRGKRVFSASARVTGMAWHVVAKTDIDEAMAPWRLKSVIVAAVIAATILFAAFMIAVLWRGQQATYRAFRMAQDEERVAMSRHFEALVRLARDPVFLIDPEGKIVDCNEAAVAAYGYSAEEFRSLPVAAIRTPQAQAEFGKQFQAALDPGGVLFETVHRRKDGTTFPVEISSRAIDVDGRPYRQSFMRDISRRRELEGEVQRIARVQKALRAANSILLRAPSEARLLEGMCDVIVHMGGYRMAFVGFANHDDAKTIGFAAIVGAEADRVRAGGIRWDDSPNGRGVTGMALKTGAIQVQQDFANNPGAARWRDELLAENYRSGISLPLRVSGSMIGTLTIYAGQTNAFDDEEVDLLTEFVDDLAYGIGALRSRAGVDLAQSTRPASG
jgi:PAS domain S-box-containing protein